MQQLISPETIGFLSVVQNNSTTDYLNLAYLQALSIKNCMPEVQYAILTDYATHNLVESKHKEVINRFIIIPEDSDYSKNVEWKLNNEWQVFRGTPFKETIKVECDMLIPRDIQHWIHAFRLRDVVLSTGCKDIMGNISDCKTYRQIFVDNDLPDVYTGLMYFRYSQFAATFFDLARDIFLNWDVVKSTLINCYDDLPTTDVVYALTAKILGVENCTIPSMDFINFVHMKPAINNWPAGNNWSEMVLTEISKNNLRVANVNQYHPFHYNDKTWPSKEIFEYYETSR